MPWVIYGEYASDVQTNYSNDEDVIDAEVERLNKIRGASGPWKKIFLDDEDEIKQFRINHNR